VEVPGEIDLDAQAHYLAEIMDGTFMNYTCTSCGKKHKPEFPLTVVWPSRNLRFEVLPELERMTFYRRKRDKEKSPAETIIGYPEMADRLAVIRDGLEPAAVEALKYYLYLKAEETYPGDEISIWYQGKTESNLEFHLHGIKKDTVAVTQVPLGVYEKTLTDYKNHPKSELFASLRFQTNLSVQNLMQNGAPN
jgi:hypothetical protein